MKIKTAIPEGVLPDSGPADAGRYRAQSLANLVRRTALRRALKSFTHCAVLFAASLTTLPAQQYAVNWFKVAGGGGTSQGAGYALRGTAGQWDAGRSSSGSHALFGGFWRAALAGAFTPGNLLVEGVGEGTGLGDYAQVVWLEEVTPDGVRAQTRYMPANSPRPATAPFNLLDEGDQIWSGQLTRSADGRLVCTAGYNGTNREPLISGSPTSTVLRVVGVLRADGALDTSGAAGMFSRRAVQSVTTKDGSGFWVAGAQGLEGASGLVYFQPGVATNSLTNATFRCVKIFRNQLCGSTMPAALGGVGNGGIFTIGSGLPTGGNPVLTQILPAGGNSPSPCGFEFNPAMTTAYVADDRANIAGGGILKYTNNGTVWVSNYTLTISGGWNFGPRGLVVDWSEANPILYATTSESSANRLVRIVDTGPGAADVTLQTAPAGTAFRGVAWTPVQLVAPVILSERMLPNQEFELTFKGGSTQGYRVLASSSIASPLANWIVLASGTFGGSPATFTDADAANRRMRFYRVVSP